ncbi:hypothetical protein [Candidatus Nitrososphaera gargensis]|uniref:hypothetical protein n=1 Tax=Candidatus Nitrososphaera gargensis TaxID=497727 RepID=UPI0011E549B3|nr:hypothetical protein [Candidatus Nitrososphaera gargensis]
MTAQLRSSLSSRFRVEHSSRRQVCLNTIPIRAFDTLGKDAKNSLLARLQSQGISLKYGSQHTLNQLMAALKPVLPKDATELIMEMV